MTRTFGFVLGTCNTYHVPTRVNLSLDPEIIPSIKTVATILTHVFRRFFTMAETFSYCHKCGGFSSGF